jgi:hypothetical protein
MTVLSKAELRTLAAAQIAGALMANDRDRDHGEGGIRNRAELAVKIAREIEEAVARSLKVESLPEPPPKPSVRIGKP